MPAGTGASRPCGNRRESDCPVVRPVGELQDRLRDHRRVTGRRPGCRRCRSDGDRCNEADRSSQRSGDGPNRHAVDERRPWTHEDPRSERSDRPAAGSAHCRARRRPTTSIRRSAVLSGGPLRRLTSKNSHSTPARPSPTRTRTRSSDRRGSVARRRHRRASSRRRAGRDTGRPPSRSRSRRPRSLRRRVPGRIARRRSATGLNRPATADADDDEQHGAATLEPVGERSASDSSSTTAASATAPVIAASDERPPAHRRGQVVVAGTGEIGRQERRREERAGEHGQRAARPRRRAGPRRPSVAVPLGGDATAGHRAGDHPEEERGDQRRTGEHDAVQPGFAEGRRELAERERRRRAARCRTRPAATARTTSSSAR